MGLPGRDRELDLEKDGADMWMPQSISFSSLGVGKLDRGVPTVWIHFFDMCTVHL